jgi:hypothetical protein
MIRKIDPESRHELKRHELKKWEDVMTICSSAPRGLWLAGAFFVAFTFSAAAQQPANPPPAATQGAAPALPPGSPLIGRPADNEAAAKLAPVAPPPIPAAVDKLPLAKLKVPAGFNIEVYTAGMANARSLAVGDKGTVFVGSRLVDKVYAIVNKDGKRTVKVLASGLYRPNGVAFKNGTLYIAELSRDRQRRRRPRQSAEADPDLRQAAQGRSPWLEVHCHRAGQQALRSGRTARQQPAA